MVALAAGRVDLPAGLAADAAAHIAGAVRPADAAPRRPRPARVDAAVARRPARRAAGTACRPAETAAYDAAVGRAAATARRRADPARARRVLVVGTEELMYLPLRLAAALARPPTGRSASRRPPGRRCTRSPTPATRCAGRSGSRARSPIRTGPRATCTTPAGTTAPRPTSLVVVVDAAADTAGPDRAGRPLRGPRRARGAAGAGRRRPAPTRSCWEPADDPPGPHAARAADRPGVRLLPARRGELAAQGPVRASAWRPTPPSREQRIQSGQAHYAESLPIEYQPDEAYQQLFATVLADSAPRLATAVGLVTDLVLAERGRTSRWCRWPGPAPRSAS